MAQMEISNTCESAPQSSQAEASESEDGRASSGGPAATSERTPAGRIAGVDRRLRGSADFIAVAVRFASLKSTRHPGGADEGKKRTRPARPRPRASPSSPSAAAGPSQSGPRPGAGAGRRPCGRPATAADPSNGRDARVGLGGSRADLRRSVGARSPAPCTTTIEGVAPPARRTSSWI